MLFYPHRKWYVILFRPAAQRMKEQDWFLKTTLYQLLVRVLRKYDKHYYMTLKGI
jgi:hypothetical protein